MKKGKLLLFCLVFFLFFQTAAGQKKAPARSPVRAVTAVAAGSSEKPLFSNQDYSINLLAVKNDVALLSAMENFY